MAISCLAVFAVAVGCRSVVTNRFVPANDSLGAPASTTDAVSTTELAATPTATPSPAPTSAGPTPAATTARPQPGSLADVAQALLDQINAWRAAEGRAPLAMASGLVASAHQHNLVMSAGCGMKHQCPDEAGLGPRISAAGISWRAVAENIAWHSSVSSAGVLAAAKGLNEAMHNETPPNDGHRRNMLSDAYTRIGIDVIRDADGEVWLTEDFAN